mgnify:CR=1 FL=1
MSQRVYNGLVVFGVIFGLSVSMVTAYLITGLFLGGLLPVYLGGLVCLACVVYEDLVRSWPGDRAGYLRGDDDPGVV